MRYVEIGEFIDPRPYLAVLPLFADHLPPQARAFAVDPAHYDFSSRRCVKDLFVRHVAWADSGGEEGLSLTLLLGANPWRHDDDLLLRYTGVRVARVELSDTPPPGPQRLGSVIMDELLPTQDGCLHELAFFGGDIVVHCSDVAATWVLTSALSNQPSA